MYILFTFIFVIFKFLDGWQHHDIHVDIDTILDYVTFLR